MGSVKSTLNATLLRILTVGETYRSELSIDALAKSGPSLCTSMSLTIARSNETTQLSR